MMRSAFLDAKTPSQTLFPEGTAPLRMFAVLFANGAPGRIRTCGLRFRKPPLYPTELRVRTNFKAMMRVSVQAEFTHQIRRVVETVTATMVPRHLAMR